MRKREREGAAGCLVSVTVLCRRMLRLCCASAPPADPQGQKDAAKQVLQKKSRARPLTAPRPFPARFTAQQNKSLLPRARRLSLRLTSPLAARAAVETLEGIAARASPEALRDAGVRAEAVSSGGKCWSIDPERLKAVEVMQQTDAAKTVAR